MNHLIKKEKTDLIIADENISMEEILNNDKMSPCYRGITQYILDENGKMKGIITSQDIKRCQGRKEKCINYHPITLLDSPLADELAARIFEKKAVRQIPVVDDNHRLLYVLERSNKYEDIFYDYTYWKYDIDYIRNMILDTRKQFPNKKVYLITTEPLEELSEYIIALGQIKEAEAEQYVLILGFRFEYDVWEIVKELRKRHIKFMVRPLFKHQYQYSTMKYINTDKMAMEVLTEEAKKNGTYFESENFSDMFQALQMTKEIEGCLVEIGVFRGDSARAMLSYMKKNNIHRKGYFLDLFEGFVYDSALQAEDMSASLLSPHTDTSLEIVENRLKEFDNISVIKSDIIQDALPEEIESIAVCNIDLGTYETEHAALNKVKNRIPGGGIIITHNYGRTPGCVSAHLAIKEFYEENKELFYGICMSSGQFLMIRK